MDHTAERAKRGLGLIHSGAHLGAVADITGKWQDFSASQRLKCPHGADALGDAVGGTVAGDIALPAVACGQAFARQQHHIGIEMLHKRRRCA